MKIRTYTLALALLAVINFTGCVTSKAPDGTVTKQVDAQAIAETTAVVITILNTPAVSNAIYQATAGK